MTSGGAMKKAGTLMMLKLAMRPGWVSHLKDIHREGLLATNLRESQCL